MKAAYVLTLLLFLVSCKSQDSGEENASHKEVDRFQTRSWALPRGSSFMSGSIPDQVITSPRIAWSFDAAAPISGDAGVYGTEVYFGSDDGVFFAVNIETGEESWRFETGDVVESEPAISSELVFFGANDGQFYALDRLTGAERWRRQFDDKVAAGANLAQSPIDREPWVLIAGNDGVLRCLKASDGTDIWSYQTDNIINGSPAMLDEKRIIFGGCDAFLHIVNLENGESIEQYETNAYIPCSVAVYDGIGYSGNYANEVLAFDPGDRGQLWTYSDRQFPFFSSPAVNETHVFIGSRDKRLHAIDREMGVAAWTYQTSGRVDSSPLAFSDAVVVGSTDGWLYAVSQIDGTELWKIELGASLIASPVFANGKLIIGSQGGTLFSLESGKTKI